MHIIIYGVREGRDKASTPKKLFGVCLRPKCLSYLCAMDMYGFILNPQAFESHAKILACLQRVPEYL